MALIFPLALAWHTSFFLLLPIFLVFYLTKRKANQPPGPPKLPIIGNLYQLGNSHHRTLKKWSEKYGPIMLLKLGKVPTLVVSSAEMAKEVLKIRDLECCSRPLTKGAARLSYNFLDVAFCPYNEYWRRMRKICVMELFSTSKVKSFGSVREQTVASFINNISQNIPNPVNLSETIFYVLDEIICTISCGRSYQGKQFARGKHADSMHEAMAMLGSFSAADFIPCIGWIIDIFTGLYARREKCFREFDDFYQKVIEEHLDPNRKAPQHEDTVDSLLKLMKDQNGDGALTHDHIKGILVDIFLGGIDTTSLTAVWAMAELIKNPRVMEKLQAEIRSCVGRKEIIVEESDCENLKYLKMVLKETLRLHPPSVLMIPHQTMEKCNIGGYDIPPNTRIQVNVFAIGRDPKTWKNPEEFYPERFADNTIDFKGQDFELIPFGAGRRICPGITMSSATLELLLANLLYHFDWELPNGMKREDVSMEEEVGLTAHKKIPLCLLPVKYMWQD